MLHDGQEHHPRDFMIGGSTEAARQFGDFADAHADRAIEIIKEFEPGKQERPAGYAIDALSNTAFPSSTLFSLVLDLHARGFPGEEFRGLGARALGSRARAGQGLPDAICSLLEHWLGEPWQRLELNTQADNNLSQEQTRPQGVLWGHGSVVTLPWGSYIVLHAHLGSPPARSTRRRPVAGRPGEACRTRGKRPGPCVFTRELGNLHLCNRSSAERFLRRLFDRFPSVRDSVFGVQLLTRAWWYLPPSRTHQFLDEIRASSWIRGVHSANLGALRTLVFPNDVEARFQVEQILDAPGPEEAALMQMRLGVAFTASHLCPESRFRERATDYLIRLIPNAKRETAYAVMGVFQECEILYPDDASFRLLRALIAHPDVLGASEDTFLVERLQDVLSAEPDLVYEVCNHLVLLRGDDLVSQRTGFAANTPHPTNMALTLQRLGGRYRSKGLELFERLLDAGVHDAQAALNELDRRPLSVTPPIQRRLHRRKRGR